MSQKDPFAQMGWNHSNMSVNGLTCTLHMPQAVKRQFNADGSERTIGTLPPGNARVAFAVDEYKAAPDAWMHGSGKASSYFVPILAEHGMWLDFNANAQHTHDVAVVISVQGVNPLTGRKIDPIRLEQHKENCPVHNTPFKQDLFCETCEFKWHPQNYLATNATPHGMFWIDGFRTEDGTIRQWFFTEEEAKGVASQLIGDQRVFAIGIAFYLSKKPKPVKTYTGGAGGSTYGTGGQVSFTNYCVNEGGMESLGTVMDCNTGPTDYSGKIAQSQDLAAKPVKSRRTRGGPRGQSQGSEEIERSLKKLEIGAGAKIQQEIYRDSENLDYWQDEPAGMIYINYCDVDSAQRIIAAGKREEAPEGFLSGLKLK